MKRKTSTKSKPRRSPKAAKIPAIPCHLLGHITAIEYVHASDGQRYRHDFTGKGKRPGLYAERGGDSLIVQPVKVSGGFIQ